MRRARSWKEWAANQAWSRRPELITSLPPHLQAMRDAQADHDAFAFALADCAFHTEIVQAAGNEVITRQYRTLRDRQMCVLTDQIRVSATRMKHAITTHRELIRLLENGTRTEFRRASRDHVIDAMARLGVRGRDGAR